VEGRSDDRCWHEQPEEIRPWVALTVLAPGPDSLRIY
jgi:hypothetical protein